MLLLAVFACSSAFAKGPSNAYVGEAIWPEMLSSNIQNDYFTGNSYSIPGKGTWTPLYWRIHLKNGGDVTLYINNGQPGVPHSDEPMTVNDFRKSFPELFVGPQESIISAFNTRNAVYYSIKEGVCFQKAIQIVEADYSIYDREPVGPFNEVDMTLAPARAYLSKCPNSGAIIED